MESRPQVDMPSFGADQLRRRNDTQPGRAQLGVEEERPVRPRPQRKMLDQDELAKLLGHPTDGRSTKPFQPLQANTLRKCWHCGSSQHLSTHCPSKPTLRDRTPPRPQPQPQLAPTETADALPSWKRQDIEVEAPSPVRQEPETDWRGRSQGMDRRRDKFDMPEPAVVKNRYEQPERRRGGQAPRRRFEQEEEEDDRVVSRMERKRLRQEAKKAAQIAKAEPTPISLPQYISVANLASMLKLRVEDFVIKLEELGFEEVQNDHILNAEHAGLVAQEYNFEPVFQAEEEDGDLYPAEEITPEEYANLPARPPVVTIMGHVDHGKTTILDYMRSTSVAANEFGGITQHIGAFSVPLANGKKITFLDTPGHSAFETMRARGANVTDIVVLVVAADDSVMPQTIEAIKHAQAAKVPIIVAINKIDKSQADPDAVKLDLGRHGIEIEDFGGDVQAVCVSGKTGQGIPELEEAISTLSELLDHRADPTHAVEGWVLEGTTKNRGRTATVLVRSGTLRQGTALVAGTTWTRVRTLRNEAGIVVPEAGPGTAVEVDGWRDQPVAGDEVLQAEDEQHASSVSEIRTDKVEREQMAIDMAAINESRRLEAARREAEAAAAAKAAAAEDDDDEATPAAPVEEEKTGPDTVNLIIKADVSGSAEALIDNLSALGNAEIRTHTLRTGVGAPSEFDIAHAAASGAIVITFNVGVPPSIARLADSQGVRIVSGNVIYRVVDDVKAHMSSLLKPEIITRVLGEADVAACFSITLPGRKSANIAGCKIRNGEVLRGSKVRVLRGEEVVFDGEVEGLRQGKKEVERVRKDMECGIRFRDFEGVKEGDRVQVVERREVARTL
jgi:translation initiation factor IF-2